MEHKGIVRKIDDLGRVVIPKEIRRTLGIKEGDPLVIDSDWQQGTITLQKYSPDNIFKFEDDALKQIEFALFDRIAAISMNVDYYKKIGNEVKEKDCMRGLKLCESIIYQICEMQGKEV